MRRTATALPTPGTCSPSATVVQCCASSTSPPPCPPALKASATAPSCRPAHPRSRDRRVGRGLPAVGPGAREPRARRAGGPRRVQTVLFNDKAANARTSCTTCRLVTSSLGARRSPPVNELKPGWGRATPSCTAPGSSPSGCSDAELSECPPPPRCSTAAQLVRVARGACPLPQGGAHLLAFLRPSTYHFTAPSSTQIRREGPALRRVHVRSRPDASGNNEESEGLFRFVVFCSRSSAEGSPPWAAGRDPLPRRPAAEAGGGLGKAA